MKVYEGIGKQIPLPRLPPPALSLSLSLSLLVLASAFPLSPLPQTVSVCSSFNTYQPLQFCSGV